VPMLGIVLILSVIASYFITFHEFIVLRRWCGPCYNRHHDNLTSATNAQLMGDDKCDSDDNDPLLYCVWSTVHPIIVIYFGIMILFHYFSTILRSPGVAFPTVSSLATEGKSCHTKENQSDGGISNVINDSKIDVHAETSLTITKNSSIEKSQEWNSIDGRGGCCFLEPKLDIAAERRLVAMHNEIGQINCNEKEEGSNDDSNSSCWYYPSPQPSFCDKCQIMRPPRCHHCSRCNRCVLQMDHHCIWMNNCIGYNNYRTFVLTIAYLVAGCWYGVALLFPSFWSIIQDQIRTHGFKFLYENKTGMLDLPPPWVMWEQIRTNGSMDPDVAIKMVLLFLCGIGSLLTGFLWNHLGYITSGKTTLEQSVWRSIHRSLQCQGADTLGKVATNSAYFKMKTPPINLFDQGWYANLEQTFGKNIFALFLPISVSPPAPYITNPNKKYS